MNQQTSFCQNLQGTTDANFVVPDNIPIIGGRSIPINSAITNVSCKISSNRDVICNFNYKSDLLNAELTGNGTITGFLR